MLLQTVFIVTLALAHASCPRKPKEFSTAKRSGNGGFKISILGEPEKYVPGSRYTVSLGGKRPFHQFLVTVEGDGETGALSLFPDGNATFDHDCLNTVVESSQTRRLPKSVVQFMWTAPMSSACITLRGMVVLSGGTWFADEGPLSRVLCALEEQTTPFAPTLCTACTEAKYQLIFEGLWRNETHPKDFPFMLWLTHFSDVIGGTHGRNFSFWGEGQLASPGLKQVAEWGSVRELEAELREKGKYLKTLIKAAGLWYPHVNENTTSTFRVDRQKHLLSIVSMLGPSPDWIVGVSGLNLCQDDGTWLHKKVIDLFPYDAGTDNGISYMSFNSATMPQEPIKIITSMYPEDPRAPFYDPSGKEMTPVARLYLTREKVITKSCDQPTIEQLEQEVSLAENTEDSDRLTVECAVSPYTHWSNCSVLCGKGLRQRTRSYLNQRLANESNCNRQLVSKEMCVAELAVCPGDEEVMDLENTDDARVCAVTEWSQWSDCSTTCGNGVRLRNRLFKDRMGHKKCKHVETVQKEACLLTPCIEEFEEIDPQCPVSDWYEWSPCSTTCNEGVRTRTRVLLASEKGNQHCEGSMNLTQTHACMVHACALDEETAKTVCLLDAAIGPCRGYFERWAFMKEKGMCVPFLYGGCRGNRNNFGTNEDCLKTCKAVLDSLELASGQIAKNVTTKTASVDCVLSSWSNWTKCPYCATGFAQKTRTIIREPRNGGKPCAHLIAKKACFRRSEFCVEPYLEKNNIG